MVSVVIPVYNAEKYITRCLNSLLAQSYGDWEAICIDDGSKDGTASILDRYAASDSRFRVVHIANGGVSNARNIALEMVSGEYLLFVDSDDFIHPQTMEICVSIIEKDESDLVAFTYSRSYRTINLVRQFVGLGESGRTSFSKYNISEIKSICTDNVYDYASEYSHPKDMDERWIIKHCQPWRCMYRSLCIKDIRFIKGIIYEDLPWWGSVLLRVRKASILNLPLYYYYPNLKSYINSSAEKFKIESLQVAIKESEAVYSVNASDAQRQKWEKNFLTPFRSKLEKKLKKFK